MTRKRFNSQLSACKPWPNGDDTARITCGHRHVGRFHRCRHFGDAIYVAIFSAAESGDRNEFEVSNGVLIDHQQIQMAMDDLVEVLSQPGISLERLKGQQRCSADDPPSICAACTDNFDESCRPQIAFDSGTEPQLACPAARPVTQWALPMSEVSLPPRVSPVCLEDHSHGKSDRQSA